MPDILHNAANAYSTGKLYLADWTGASEDLLHVHAGLAIYAFAILLSKRRLGSVFPIALVVAFAALNEVVDHLSARERDWGESLIDFANTVAWPAVLFVLGRQVRRLR